jgi:hypothetical protein
MLDYTLRAIEIVNIADIGVEKERLVTQNESLNAKRAELDRQEDILLREKAKKDARRGGKKARAAMTTEGSID